MTGNAAAAARQRRRPAGRREQGRLLQRPQLQRQRRHRRRLRAFACRDHCTAAGDVLVTADDTRSQADNRELCLARLVSIITAATTRPKKRKKTKPSRGSKERRLKAKRVASDKKQRRNWKSGD